MPNLSNFCGAERDIVSRRRWLQAAACAGLGVAAVAAKEPNPDDGLVHARRPIPPYRAWFQPRLFERNVDLYANMTIDASGWLDPRLAEALGKTTLDWAWGINNPDSDGPEEWRVGCSVAGRSRPRKNPTFVSAGIAADEWTRPAKPENVEWFCEGLRAGRRENPDVFIAVWSTDPKPPLIELTRDGTVDLVIIEGYTHSVKKGESTSWDNALRRCDAMADAGLANKTIFGFGHITEKQGYRGTYYTGREIRKQMEEIKSRYPTMPGVGFFEPVGEDTPELRELVRACDRLSAEFWPSAS